MKRIASFEKQDNHALVKKGCTSRPLNQLLNELRDVFSTPGVDFDVVEKRFFDAVEQVPFSDWTSFAYFDGSRYSRNLLAAEENFSLIMNCWEPGQATPVHSHEESQASLEPRKAWSYVLEGDVMLVHYSDEADSSGSRKVLSTMLFNRSNPRFTERFPRKFHVLENINRTHRAMTLHLYSPAFLNVCWESRTHQQHIMPVSYTPLCSGAIKSSWRLLNQNNEPFYMSFASLATMLSDELKRGLDIQRIAKMLRSLRFNPKEFRRYANFTAGKYTRNLVGYNGAFTLLMLCWDVGQESPIHNHAGSSCFMKILEGELHEVRYDASVKNKLALSQITQMREEDVAYIDDTQGVHKMVNPSRTHGAISLHVYIPPYTKCSIFNLAEGSCNVVDMTASNAYSDKPLTPMLLSDQKPIVSVSELLEKLRSVFGASEDALCLSGSRNSAIQDTLDRVQFVADEWRDLVHFSDHNYTRMLLTLNEHFSLMLNCWKPQQACPLHSHDHSPENTMFVKSIAGALEIRRFADEAGTQKLSEVVIESDSPCLAVANSDLGLHTTRNPSTTCVALTLHLYTPPMVECIHAGGIAPVVYSKAATDLSVGAPSPTKDRAMGSISAAPQASLFSNFQALVEMLSNVFDKYPDQSADLLAPKIKSILHKFEANPKEVRDYYGPHVDGTPLVRCRIGLHAKFEVYVVFWKAGYVSPIHSHGQSSEFIKVIDGEMTDTHFSTPERGLPPYVVSANVLKSCGTTFLSSKTVHQTRVPNMDSSALLVYSPPYVESVTFASDTGAATRVSVSNSDCFSCCTKE